jgi:DNA polymerase I-like protein with 3'-5' exonuclease and polymerase domains
MKRLPPEEQRALFQKIDAARKKGKSTNYAATYGAGPPTIARGAGVSEAEGRLLHQAYWKLNWSIPAVAKTLETKEVSTGLWLKNPVSGFWYSLRHEKDRWSTLNQGTGVYCFDTWIKHFRKRRSQLTGQMHDEVILCIKKGHREGCTSLLRSAILATNKELKLNRDLDIDVQFGSDYSKIH